MPRLPRLILPGIAAHIIQRGNDRGICFREDGDYLAYLAHLRELAKRLDCAVHAYCLMTNHVHLLVTPATADGCTALMRDLGQRYVQYFNRAHRRTGTLWEGRYRSCVAESAGYVLACYRYIELNPVRAGMVDSPMGYRWSSHAMNAGIRTDPLVCSHPEFTALGQSPQQRCAAYLQLFEKELTSAQLVQIRDSTNGGYPLGSESFTNRIAVDSGRRIQRHAGGRPRRVELAKN